MKYAKSLQSCPTLCDPINGSLPGSPVPGILQARTLGWVAISFSNAWKRKVKVKSFSHVWLLVTPWTAAYQPPPSMGFSRQEYWNGLPFPSPQTDNRYFYNQECVCMLSFAWLFETPWTLPVRLSCPWILQARILEWIFISYSRGFSWPRNQTGFSGIGRGFFYQWVTWEAPTPKYMAAIL